MCWHKWVVKETQVRPVCKRLKEMSINRLFVYSALFTAAIVGGVTFLLPLEETATPDIVGAMTGGWLILLLISFFVAAFSIDFLDITLKDKICSKCHLTILDASEAKIVANAIAQQNLVKQQEKENILRDVDKVFKHRKQMWKVAKKGQK